MSSNLNDPYKISSKRQRFFDIVKTAKETYIPTIQSTVTQLASEAKNKAINYTESFQQSQYASRDLQQQQQRYQQQDQQLQQQPPEYNCDVRGAEILIYPHFTRHNSNEDYSSYFTQVHGLVYSAEGGTRKKRFFLGLARQLAKVPKNGVMEPISAYEAKLDTFNTSVAEFDDSVRESGSNSRPATSNSLNNNTNNNNNDISDDSSSIGSTLSADSDEVLKERIAAFFHRVMGNTELTVAVAGSEKDQLEVQHVITDANGNFNLDVKTQFKPSFIQVAISLDEKIFAQRDCFFAGSSRWGIISDIDDTIKRTGVCGDKRSLFRNCFSDDITTWEIPGAAACYSNFSRNFQMPVFYVSNSPYQLFANLNKFFSYFEFPEGSMYLKKYSGNFLGTMWEPSHARKRVALERIIRHYGDKRFFLIGDSGEQDLEAYTDLAKSYPENVAGVFIRIADSSMSQETYFQIQDILNKKNPAQRRGGKIVQYYNNNGDLIDLYDDQQQQQHQHQFSNNMNLLDLEKQAERKSNEILSSHLSMENGDTSSFFGESRKLLAQGQQQHPPKRKPPPPEIPPKPEHLRTTAPSIPIKSEYLRSKSPTMTPPPLPQRPIPTPPPPRSINNTPASSSFPRSAGSFPHYRNAPPSSLDSLNVGQMIKMIPYTEEKHEDWLSRVMTSAVILGKLQQEENHIRLMFFKSFEEVERGIYEVLEEIGEEDDEDLL